MSSIEIAGRRIGPGEPTFVTAEISANHNGSIERAKELISLAKKCGADAVKIQSYTADTITLDVRDANFSVDGTIWAGTFLYDLYQQAQTPLEWHAELFAHANQEGIICFSSPFDSTAIDLLEKLNTPAYKIASPELVDIPLIKQAAKTGKPLIISTGMGTAEEISEAVSAARDVGNSQIILLKCTSAYPARIEDANLHTLADMANRFETVVGLSDHTLDNIVALTAAAKGGCFVEKHFTFLRSEGGPDAAFSLEPQELRTLVTSLRQLELCLGEARYGPTEKEKVGLRFRKSILISKDVKKGDLLTADNVRVVRPSHGMHPRHYHAVLGKVFEDDYKKGDPLLPECFR